MQYKIYFGGVHRVVVRAIQNTFWRRAQGGGSFNTKYILEACKGWWFVQYKIYFGGMYRVIVGAIQNIFWRRAQGGGSCNAKYILEACIG